MLDGLCLPWWIDVVAKDEAAALDKHGAILEAIDNHSNKDDNSNGNNINDNNNDDNGDDNNDNNDDLTIDGPWYLGKVTLAIKKSVSSYCLNL